MISEKRLVFKRFVRPKPTFSHCLGIDFGRARIKCVLLEETPGSVVVRQVASAPTPENAIQNGAIIRPKEVTECLRRLLKTVAPHARNAMAAVPVEQTMIRLVELPAVEPAALQNLARFEARKYLAYPVEQAEVTATPLLGQSSLDETKVRALLVATPQEAVLSRANVIEQAGLEIVGIESEAFAMLRALQTRIPPQGKFWRIQPHAYLILGEESSGIVVTRNETPLFLRSIAWGGKRITETLQQAWDYPADKIYATLTAPRTRLLPDGSLYWEEDGFVRTTDALQDELTRLLREIIRLISYFRSLYPERSYESVLSHLALCGGIGSLPGLADYFTEQLRLKVLTGQPFATGTLTLAPAVQSLDSVQHASFSIAHGLALGGLERCMESSPAHAQREFLAHYPTRSLPYELATGNSAA